MLVYCVRGTVRSVRTQDRKNVAESARSVRLTVMGYETHERENSGRADQGKLYLHNLLLIAQAESIDFRRSIDVESRS